MSLADMRAQPAAAMALQSLRSQLSDVEVDEYRDFFDLVDTDHSNAIDSSELQQLLVMMGISASDSEIKEMIGEVATDGDDDAEVAMDFEEFLTLMATFVGPRGA